MEDCKSEMMGDRGGRGAGRMKVIYMGRGWVYGIENEALCRSLNGTIQKIPFFLKTRESTRNSSIAEEREVPGLINL